ncbi:isochorismate synthase [Halomonas sp. PA5]|nr:isochorismate synthase [Halomonas sp. PA5]
MLAIKKRLAELRGQAPHGFVRLTMSIAIADPLAWLSLQVLLPRLYWQGREPNASQYATLGCVHEITDPTRLNELGLLESGGALRYFGGLAFDPTDTRQWPAFGGCRFLLPRIELMRQGDLAQLSLNLLFDSTNHEAELAAAETALDAIRPERPLPGWEPISFTRHDRPEPSEWAEWVNEIIQPAFQSHTQKVVLSRESRLVTHQPIDPWQLLHHWQVRSLDCFHFAYQFSPADTFIGCSPERLYRRDGRQLLSEALAGTMRRSGDTALDHALASVLHSDTKNRHENRIVQADICRRLAPLSRDIRFSEPHILKLRLLQHLRCDIEAELLEEVADWQLLKALHPTPAVGGMPHEHALDFIRTHEAHARGWYAGACGIMSREHAEFTVAIRSARVTANAVSLFAGAGIVEGSEPYAEWQELDTKIANVMSMLG